VTCEQGHQHWGLFGAAGVLVWAPDPEDEAGSLVLLQHRAGWSHQGGTWALPGGAMDSDETPAEAALREADEECMLDPKLVVPRAMYSEEHGGWAYHTIVAQAAEPFRVYSDSYESDGTLWLPPGQVDRLDLHPGFAASWPALRKALSPLTVFVDGAGAPPLRARLTGLTRTGLAALPGGLAVPGFVRWYPDYVLVLARASGERAARGAAEAAPASEAVLADKAEPASGSAGYSWNQPLVVRRAEVQAVAADGRAQTAGVLAGLAGSTPGRRLVVSGRPEVRDRAAEVGAGVADLNWLLGLDSGPAGGSNHF
jgi:8-oxo-dGTP pyrophosphatase MutT (NUDIX family)